MTFSEYLDYIIKKFQTELKEGWYVEESSFYSSHDGYLHITNSHWHFTFTTGAIHEMYWSGTISAETAYQGIKKILEQDYLKQLWKQT